MIGDFAENLVSTLIGRWTQQGHLFEIACIGGKWPVIDIYAETRTKYNQKIFCFFQVKSTKLGYTKRSKKLNIKVSKEDLNALAGFHAPTYLVGVDYVENSPQDSKCYIKVVRGVYIKGITGMETTYELNSTNLILLKTELEAYWATINPLEHKSTYKTQF